MARRLAAVVSDGDGSRRTGGSGNVKSIILILVAVGVGIEIGGRMPGDGGIVAHSISMMQSPSRTRVSPFAAKAVAGKEEEEVAAPEWTQEERAAIASAISRTTRATNATTKWMAEAEKIQEAVWMKWTGKKEQDIAPLMMNVTPSMLRRSRPVVGNVERLRRLGQRLRGGHCVHLLVLGASVSMGRNVGGIHSAWHQRFLEYLNLRYPCRDGASNEHHRTLMLLGATGTAYAANTVRAWHEGWLHDEHGAGDGAPAPFDLVVVEFNANDGAFSGIDGENFDSGLAWWTEVLARQLLRLQLHADAARAQHAPAIVWLEATYQGAPWLNVFGKTRGRPQVKLKYIGHQMAAWVHYSVMQYYQIPMVSVSDVMFPLAMKYYHCPADVRTGSRLANEFKGRWPCVKNNTFWADTQHTASSYSFWDMHTDVCCHPTAEVHHVIARVLAHNIDREVFGPDAQSELPPHERDFTLYPEHYKPVRTVVGPLPAKKKTSGSSIDSFGLDPEWVLSRPPWRLTTEELTMFVLARKKIIDFTGKTSSAQAAERSLVGDTGPNGWSVFADSKQKFGLIATRAGAHAAVPVDLYSENDWLAVGHLTSYQNVSSLAAWLDKSPKDDRSVCTATATVKGMTKHFRKQPHKKVIGGRSAWHNDGARTSVYTLTDLFSPQVAKREQLKEAPATLADRRWVRQRFYLHLCLLGFEGAEAEKYTHTGKFKIMNIVSTSRTLD